MNGIKVLVVEDEERLRNIIKKYLSFEGYTILEAENGEEAIHNWQIHHPDIIILDAMLPLMDGWEVCRFIRRDSHVPIIMLTACSQEDDKIRGFEYGVDQYMTKPFSTKELIARMKSILRKNEKISIHNEYSINGLTIYIKSHKVVNKNGEVRLTPKEYELLIYLINNRSIVLSRDIILNAIWGREYEGDLRTVDTHIKMLRQKLSMIKNNIQTIRGTGYKFEVFNDDQVTEG
ncbi:response regulator transcription factor [Vallitalea okinawensis]|uniref:response regulator transcription factor n=1 Tax=Vallitalea okinawensis TaxID=2078660 RepID=UPI000CFDCFDF|nr:response regulator transcription factor [Vallitalea okinawensis]